jgi:hypothetical protein
MSARSKRVLGLVAKKAREAEKAYLASRKREKDADYMDLELSLERAFAEGYAEAFAHSVEIVEGCLDGEERLSASSPVWPATGAGKSKKSKKSKKSGKSGKKGKK